MRLSNDMYKRKVAVDGLETNSQNLSMVISIMLPSLGVTEVGGWREKASFCPELLVFLFQVLDLKQPDHCFLVDPALTSHAS